MQRVEMADEGLGIEAWHLRGIRKSAGKDRNPRGVLEDMKLVILPILAVLAAGTIAACGGSDNSSTSSSPTSNTGNSGGGGAYGAAPKATNTPAASGAVSIKTAKGEPGTFLVDSSGRAPYLFEADKSSTSTCNGACAAAWPPLTTTGAPTAGTGVKASLLGTSKRDDGKMEVTYDGHPLYYFANDTAPGDIKGQGVDAFGAEWYVVGTNGKKLEGDESH
jgi:predicted lipoprotein with Yx(FWY)xxD motif